MNDDKLFSWLASVKGDPLAFVMGAFPWGEPGTVLETSQGPEQWACDLMNRIRDGLIDINTAIQEAIASGHGIAFMFDGHDKPCEHQLYAERNRRCCIQCQQ